MPEGRRAGQGAVAAQGDARGQGPGLAEADRGVASRRDGEGAGRVLGEGRRGPRGERRVRCRHRQGEGLGRRVGVAVGRRDGDRVAAGAARTPGCRPGCRRRPGSRPRAGPPLSVKLIGVSPLAVTAKVPAVLSANVVEAAEVNTGGEAVTVKVKDCVEVFELASVAVMVIG